VKAFRRGALESALESAPESAPESALESALESTLKILGQLQNIPQITTSNIKSQCRRLLMLRGILEVGW